jgi:mRNA interferase RelE/StbE
MGSYEIHWKTSAERDLRNIDPQQVSRIIKAVEALVDTPLPLIYQLDTETKIVIIYHVRHRREAYRKL